MLAATATSDERSRLLRVALDSLIDPCVVLEPVRDEGGVIVDFAWVDANRAACE